MPQFCVLISLGIDNDETFTSLGFQEMLPDDRVFISGIDGREARFLFIDS